MTDVISRVLIKCPKLGTNVHTEFYRLRARRPLRPLRGEYSFRCDRCGDIHTWRREDAWLEDGSRLRTVVR